MRNSASKIFSQISALCQQVKAWQEQGERVVFTNGCFDILHLGHVDYLEKACELGNRLVIGVNTDKSVKRLKGESRPINNEYARCRVLAALSFTDAIILFDEETPLCLIKEIQPDILVKGADYKVENIVGADIVLARGGEVKAIEFTEGYSTTQTIARMRAIKC